MVKYLVICAVIGLSIMAWSEIPVLRGPGIMADAAPKYELLDDKKNIAFDGNTYSPFKKVTATVRLVEKDRYFLDDMAKFSKYDVLVSWGETSDQKNLDYISFKLKERDFSYNQLSLPLDSKTINEQTLLWHLVASTEEIENEIFKLREGHIITVKGLLVDVTTKAGMSWYSMASESKFTKSANKHDILWVSSIRKK